MLIEYVNLGRSVLIDDRGEIVHIGRRCFLEQRRADELERLKPGLLALASAPASAFSGAAPVAASPPMPVASGVVSEDSTATVDEAPSEDVEPAEAVTDDGDPFAVTIDEVLAMHHSKRKRIAKEVTGRKLSAAKSDRVIKAMTPEQVAEVATKFAEV